MAEMLDMGRRRGTIGFFVIGVGLVGLTLLPGHLSAADDCITVAAGSIQESEKFTPYEGRLTHVPPRPINPKQLQSEAASAMSPARLDDLGVAWAATSYGRSVTYYLAEPIGDTMTSEGFFAAGGVLVMSEMHDPGAGDHVTALKEQLGDRVTVVKVGRYQAALTWGDPRANGVRPHVLSWTQESMNISVIAERTAERIVNLGRGMAC